MTQSNAGDQSNAIINLIDEVDDVEGHGLKEVAAGIGVAAVVVGGGAGVAQGLTHSAAQQGAVHVSTTSTSVQADVADPIGALDRATDRAVSDARAARDGAMGTASTTATGAQSTATGTAAAAVTYTQSVAAAAQTIAHGVTNYAASTATGTATGAATTARAAAATASDTATGTAAATTAYAGHVASAAGNLANQTVSSIAPTVQTTLRTANTVAGNAVTTVVNVTQLGAGAAVDAATATGWVRVSAGGVMLGEAHVSSGEATVHWVDPTGDRTVTLTYSGDDVFPGSSIAL